MVFARLVFFIIILCLLELFLVPLPLVFIALFLFFHYYNKEGGIILAMIAGFLFDILLLFPLGTTPMIFMGLLFLPTLYRRKYEATNLFFLAVVVFISILVFEFILSRTIAISSALFGMIATVIVGRFFVPSPPKYESWNRV